MAETLVGVDPPAQEQPSMEGLDAARELVRQARSRGVALTGPDGLLKALTKTVFETALDEEMAEHLGYDKHAPEGRNLGNSRSGKRSKTVLTDACGQVEIDVPRDRDGSFEPQLVRKRQRRLSDVDEVVLSLFAKGLTTGEISAHFAQVYGAIVAKDTVSRITDRVIEEMQPWWNRPWDRVYAAVFIDAIMVKVRDGQVGNRPVYAAIGVDLDGATWWAFDTTGTPAVLGPDAVARTHCGRPSGVRRHRRAGCWRQFVVGWLRAARAPDVQAHSGLAVKLFSDTAHRDARLPAIHPVARPTRESSTTCQRCGPTVG